VTRFFVIPDLASRKKGMGIATVSIAVIIPVNVSADSTGIRFPNSAAGLIIEPTLQIKVLE
jgi:hypothetical protein